MKLKIISDLENVLLGRREIIFSVSHPSSCTPRRGEIRRQIAARFNVELDCVYVMKMVSKTGRDLTEGDVRIYNSPERAKLVERDYILKRNTLSGEEAQTVSE